MIKILFTIFFALLSGFGSGAYVFQPAGGDNLNLGNFGSLWFPDTDNTVTLVDNTWGLKIPSLASITCLGVDGNGVFGAGSCSSGSGSGGGTWSTTTSSVSGRFINYPNNATDIVTIGSNATTSAEYWFDPNTLRAYLSGNVGIGTTSPYAPLSVLGQIVATNFFATSTTATSTFAGGLVVDTNTLVVDYANNEVGIGTLSPARQLHVYGAGQATSSLEDSGNVGGTIYIQDSTGLSNNGGALVFGLNQGYFAGIKGLGVSGGGNTTGDLAFSTRNATADTKLTERMRITLAGNVGIGSSTPMSKLAINETVNGGGITIGGNASNLGIKLINTATGGTTWNIHSTDNVSGWGGTKLVFTEGAGFGASRMALISGGNLGLGTTGPNEILHVKRQNDSGGVNIRIQNSSTNANSSAGIVFTNTSNDAYTSQEIRAVRSPSNELLFLTDGSERFRINSSGMGIGTTTPRSKLEVAGGTTNAVNSFVLNPSSSGNRSLWIDGNAINARLTNQNIVSSAAHILLQSDSGAGSVAIGTTSPAGVLHIKAGTNKNFIFGTNATLTSGAHFVEYDFNETTNYGYIQARTADVAFRNFVINPNGGNLGVGTTSPYEKLSVTGNVVADSFYATSSIATSTFAGGVRVTGSRGIRLDSFASCSALETNASGDLACGVDDSSAGGGTYPFTPTDLDGTIYSATTSPMFIINDSGLLIARTSTTGTSSLTYDTLSFTNNGFVEALGGLSLHGVTYNILSSGLSDSAFVVGGTGVGYSSDLPSIYNGVYLASFDASLLTTNRNYNFPDWSGNFAISTSSLSAPYFNATSTTATSTFNGAINVLGNLGVGTTSGSSSLIVKGNGASAIVMGDASFSNFAGIKLGGYGPMTSTSYNLLSGTSDQSLYYNVPTSYTHRWRIGNTDTMYLTSTGLGIGSTSPSAKLVVQGSGTGAVLAGEWGGSSSYGAIGLTGSLSTGNANFYSSISDANLYINRRSGAGINFVENNGTTQVRIASGGNVGIGTSSPETLLDVDGVGTFGTENSTGPQIIIKGGTSGTNLIELRRTAGAVSTFGFSLAGGGLAMSDVTNGFITANFMGDAGINELYLGQRGKTGSDSRTSLLSATTFSASAGTDVAGNALILRAGLGTGAGAPGDLTFQTGTALGSGTTAQTGATRLTLKGTTGNLGLGTTSPYARLAVVGDVVASNFISTSTTATSTFAGGVDLSNARVKQHIYPSFTWPAGINTATTTTATTTISIGPAKKSQVFNSIMCTSISGTIGYRVTDGTNAMEFRQATSTASDFSLSTNNTFSVGETRLVEIGPITASYLTCTTDITINN